MNLLSLLTDSVALTPDDAKVIADEARASNTPIEVLLEKRGISVEDTLKRASEKYGMPLRSLPSQSSVGKEALDYIPEAAASL